LETLSIFPFLAIDLDEGTLRQILKTMGLSVDEFLRLASN